MRLYLAINKYSLEKWAKHELKDPPPKDLNEREAFEQRFSVDSGNQVIYVCDCWNVRDNLRDILDSHTFENSRLLASNNVLDHVRLDYQRHTLFRT